MQTRHWVPITWLALAWPLVLWAEPPPSVPVEGHLSVLLIDAQRISGELKYLHRLTVTPFVVPDPSSKTGWTVNLPREGSEDQRLMGAILNQSIGFQAKSIRDEVAPKFVELGQVCGPEAKVSLMTTPAPGALGYDGEIAKHIQMIGLKGCSEEGILYRKRINAGKSAEQYRSLQGVDCFVDRTTVEHKQFLEDSCCFTYKDLNNFLDRCIVDVRAYKQARGLLPAPR